MSPHWKVSICVHLHMRSNDVPKLLRLADSHRAVIDAKRISLLRNILRVRLNQLLSFMPPGSCGGAKIFGQTIAAIQPGLPIYRCHNYYLPNKYLSVEAKGECTVFPVQLHSDDGRGELLSCLACRSSRLRNFEHRNTMHGISDENNIHNNNRMLRRKEEMEKKKNNKNLWEKLIIVIYMLIFCFEAVLLCGATHSLPLFVIIYIHFSLLSFFECARGEIWERKK